MPITKLMQVAVTDEKGGNTGAYTMIRLIDYIDRLPLPQGIDKDKMADWSAQLQQAVARCGVVVVTIKEPKRRTGNAYQGQNEEAVDQDLSAANARSEERGS
jgi:hypothetical protein